MNGIKLSASMSGNDNNLNLLRVVAALLVLVSHSFVIVSGDVDREPLRPTYGLTFGSIAVDVFFVVSGLLVTRSIANRNDAVAFITARALRIWPELVVSLLLVAYVLGGAVTGLPHRVAICCRLASSNCPTRVAGRSGRCRSLFLTLTTLPGRERQSALFLRW